MPRCLITTLIPSIFLLLLPKPSSGGFLSQTFLGRNHASATNRLDSSAVFSPASNLNSAVPLDLWAIHDLLIVGRKGPLLQPTASASHQMVDVAANKLGSLMCDIHPVPACREAVCQADSLVTKAEASWNCLGLTADNFTEAYTSDSQANVDVDRTTPLFMDRLGVCRDSQWQRACSYWISMHALSIRADIAQKGQEFLQAVVEIIAGGALYCSGCTNHFRLLNKNLLSAEVIADDIVAY